MTEAHRAIGVTLPIANDSAEKQIALTAFGKLLQLIEIFVRYQIDECGQSRLGQYGQLCGVLQCQLVIVAQRLVELFRSPFQVLRDVALQQGNADRLALRGDPGAHAEVDFYKAEQALKRAENRLKVAARV